MKASIAVGKPLSFLDVPSRTRPMQYLADIQAIADRLSPGQAVEVDAEKISEHSVRKYLAILGQKNPSYLDYIVRTAACTNGTGRRRIYITRMGRVTLAAGDAQQIHGPEVLVK